MTTALDLDERTAFLRAIHEQPDDDAIRLVYADWLQEQDILRPCTCLAGQALVVTRRGTEEWRPCSACDATGTLEANHFAARAEFIRVQCALAKVNVILNECSKADISAFDPIRAKPAKRQKELRERERELFGAVNCDWSAGFTDSDVDEHSLKCWSRGFVSRVTLDWELWLTHHAAILAHPDVCLLGKGAGVTLTTRPAWEWYRDCCWKADNNAKVNPSNQELIDELVKEFPDPLTGDPIKFTLPGANDGHTNSACEACGGTGGYEDTGTVRTPCQDCNGTGVATGAD